MQPNSLTLAVCLVAATVTPLALIAADGRGATDDRVQALSAAPFLPQPVCTGACRQPRKAEAVVVGQSYPQAQIIKAPGLYGLHDPREGESYAALAGMLVRIDSDSHKVLSVLRQIDRPLQ